MSGSDLGTGWGPYPGQQTKFYTAAEDEVFGGGAGGGGKSLLEMMKICQQLVVEHQRFKKGEIKRSRCWGLFLRRKTTDLEQMIDMSHEYFPEFDSKAKYNNNTGTWTFHSCGDAKFQFDHMQHVKDRFRYKSSAFTYVALDELTEFEEIQYLYIQSRIRTKDPVLKNMLQIVSGSNPDGPGLLWVRDRFIEGKEPERVYRTKHTLEDGRVMERDSVFIPFRLKDNPALYESGQYELQLRGLPPEIQEAILNGNWYYASGAYLARVWDSRYHVCPNHAVPSGASITRSMDYGYSKPGSCTWWYLDRDGVLTAFYNLYLTEHTPEMWAARIQEVEEEFGLWDEENNCSRITGPLDTGCWDKQNSKTCVAQRLREKGVRFFKAKKGPGSRLNSAVELISRMRMRIKSEAAPDDRLQDKPGIRWMERCGAPIRTLPILRPDPNNAEDVDSSGEDHCMSPYTIIRTKEGDIPIVSMVGREGFVPDRFGRWTPYRNCRLTRRNSPTVMIVFSDGVKIQCTPDHRFREVGGEWVEAKDLQGRYCMEVGSGGFTKTATTRTESDEISIGKCGSTPMASRRQTMRFTTSIIARLTTAWKTSLAFLRAFIEVITTPILPFALPRLSESKRPASPPRFGMSWSSARYADPSILQGASIETKPDTAPLIVSSEETTKWLLRQIALAAKFVERNSTSSLGLGAQRPAATAAAGLYVVSVHPASSTDVYCIEVPDGHEFALPNGAITSNCYDEARYECASKPLVPQKEQDPDEDDVDNVVDIRSGQGRVGVGSWARRTG